MNRVAAVGLVLLFLVFGWSEETICGYTSIGNGKGGCSKKQVFRIKRSLYKHGKDEIYKHVNGEASYKDEE